MSSTCPHCGSILGFGHTNPTDTIFTEAFGDVFKDVLASPIDDETLKLAQMVADMEPLPNDPKSIEEWAKRLAADISKGRD